MSSDKRDEVVRALADEWDRGSEPVSNYLRRAYNAGLEEAAVVVDELPNPHPENDWADVDPAAAQQNGENIGYWNAMCDAAAAIRALIATDGEDGNG